MPTTITKSKHHTTCRVFRVAEIRPNPFRDSKRYPLQADKIAALRESIRTTSFWDNLVARIGKDGKPEIAYGHHRLEALRQEVGDDAEIRLIIRELDDTQMLKMMLRENMAEWQTNALVDQASVRAVVDAYADGKVELRPPEAKTPKATLRYAPGFRQGDVPGRDREHPHPYTAATLAAFLGWDRTKVETTLAALELIERGLVDEYLYEYKTQSQAGVLTNEVRKVVSAHETEAKECEKQADTARKQAEAAKSDKERTDQMQLAESALQEAAAVRKRMEERADFVAWSAHLGVMDDATARAIAARLAGLKELPPLPQAYPREPWSDATAIQCYIEQLGEYIKHVQQIRPLAEQFSPEQMDKAFNGGLVLQQELAVLETALKEVFHERQERGVAPSGRSSKRNNKGKSRKGAKTARLASSHVVA